jgi:hypothetical protein
MSSKNQLVGSKPLRRLNRPYWHNHQPRIYAIDCEMAPPLPTFQLGLTFHSDDKCLTEDGKELTGVCMIDYDTELVIYDQLVKP